MRGVCVLDDRQVCGQCEEGVFGKPGSIAGSAGVQEDKGGWDRMFG